MKRWGCKTLGNRVEISQREDINSELQGLSQTEVALSSGPWARPGVEASRSWLGHTGPFRPTPLGSGSFPLGEQNVKA